MRATIARCEAGPVDTVSVRTSAHLRSHWTLRLCRCTRDGDTGSLLELRMVEAIKGLPLGVRARLLGNMASSRRDSIPLACTHHVELRNRSTLCNLSARQCSTAGHVHHAPGACKQLGTGQSPTRNGHQEQKRAVTGNSAPDNFGSPVAGTAEALKRHAGCSLQAGRSH
jgi:hypothetical protein